jgi:hypothetical protein
VMRLAKTRPSVVAAIHTGDRVTEATRDEQVSAELPVKGGK